MQQIFMAILETEVIGMLSLLKNDDKPYDYDRDSYDINRAAKHIAETTSKEDDKK